jgi:pterin-4a-carbinolamine dehydratase
MADAKTPSTASSGKRKRAAKITYYAVKQGHTPDIYYSWADVQKQITGHKAPMRAFPYPYPRTSLTHAQMRASARSQKRSSS